MAESFSEAGKAFRAGASIILPTGGKVLINISTDNVEVAAEGIEKICKTVTTLGALYIGYKSLRFLIETAVKKALGGERDDEDVGDIGPGSLHVRLHCFTDKRFLEVLADYESGKMKERLQEEFSQVGIKVKGMRVEIENMVEVNRTKEAIKKRNLCKDVENTDEGDGQDDKNKSYVAVMKPIPDNESAFMEEATSLGLLGPNPSFEKPRAKLLECIHNSMMIQRSFNHVSILLFGAVGVGKSATVNLAETSETQSETRSTKEFVVHGNCPKYEVAGLSLGLVDTSGFFSLDGSNQDACNLLHEFFRTHPSLSSCYPNLIFLFATAPDNRIKGENSDFGKSLRCIKQLGLVDPDNPNVVVILTHACSILKRNDEEWTKALDKIKSTVTKMVFNDLEVYAPVVLIENMYEDCNLEHRGDYTVLPNGELQPQNLYEACVGVLKNNNDSLGLITFNSIFVESMNVRGKTLWFEFEAKNAKQYTLADKAWAWVQWLVNAVRGGPVVSKIKLLPHNERDLLQEVISLGLVGPTPSLEEPRAKLLACIQRSMKIQRSFNHVSILLVGKTGDGKSATINHLLGVDYAKTNETQSETKSIEEFVVHGSDLKYEVEGLSLGLVDTPGFWDTDGPDQIAYNLLSMQKFLKTHPSLSNCYPNLVFLLVKASDKRLLGKDSELQKSLRCVKLLNIVDHNNPNVVTILSHAGDIQKKTNEEWTKELDKIKSTVSKFVSSILNVSVPVVAIENNYDDCDLEHCGDYTRLRSGELQPKNLYDACAEVLGDDSLGLITLNSIFREAKKDCDRTITTGHKYEAKKQYKFGSEEKKTVELFENAAKEGFNDVIYNALIEYINKKNLKDCEVGEMMQIANVLRNLGEGNTTNFRSHSLQSIKCDLGKEISTTGKKMLQERFNIKMDPPCKLLPSGRLIGQGYNILTDKSVATQVMNFDVMIKYGMPIPVCAKFEKVQQSRSFMEVFEDEKSYTQSRLKSLNVNLNNVKPDIFKMSNRAGYNKKVATSSFSKSQYSFVLEQRLFELKLGNYRDYLNNGMTFTKDFKSDVAKLPSKYDRNNRSCVNMFERFFNRFGHFLVSSAYGGGSVEGKYTREVVGSAKTSLAEVKAYLAECLDAAEVGFLVGTFNGQKNPALLEHIRFLWDGGEADLQTNGTIRDMQRLQKWKKSLSENPTMLTSEMTLEPISTAVGCIDPKKAKATYEALKDILESDIQPPEKKEKEDTQKEAMKRRKNANTRIESLIEPNLSNASCFPSGSVVKVQNRDGEVKQKKMTNLDVEDKVMGWDQKRNRTVFTKVIMFAHLEPDAVDVEYLKITLEDENRITLSGNHLVMVGKQKRAILARKLKPGDIVFRVDENRKISPKKVLEVEKVIEQGIFCPITLSGNVMVDNVLASCYASVEDYVLFKGLVKISAQNMAHLGLMPMRALHKLRSKWLRKIPNGQTIHPYVQWLCKLNLPCMVR